MKKYIIPFSEKSFLLAKSAMKDDSGAWKNIDNLDIQIAETKEHFKTAQEMLKALEKAYELNILSFSNTDQENMGLSTASMKILIKEINNLLN